VWNEYGAAFQSGRDKRGLVGAAGRTSSFKASTHAIEVVTRSINHAL
jgi:hypothetical protein